MPDRGLGAIGWGAGGGRQAGAAGSRRTPGNCSRPFGRVQSNKCDNYRQVSLNYCMIGKLASLLAVTVTPRKDTNVRPPVGGPYFGGVFCSSFLVLPLFVPVGSVGIAPFTLRLPPPFTSPCAVPAQTIILPTVARAAHPKTSTRNGPAPLPDRRDLLYMANGPCWQHGGDREPGPAPRPIGLW